ncbi:MAG: vWFA protein [Podoviridae sp. ctLUJ1]|nr:MAG: vWFA protein [Podoviridae sp. ctLUJ1]
MSQQKIDTFLRSCLDSLIGNLDSTYYGRIISHLPMLPDTAIDSFAVSKEGEFLYNPNHEDMVNKNKIAVLRSMLHEGMHIALEHFARADYAKVQSKEAHQYFNIAADCEIENIIDKDFPYIPKDKKHHDCLKNYVPRPYWGDGTEAIYKSLYAGDGQQQNTPQNSSSVLPQLSDLGKQRIHAATQKAAQEAVDAINDAAINEAGKNTVKDPTGSNSQGTGKGVSNVSDGTLKLLGIKRPKLNSFAAIEALFKNAYGRGEAKDDSTFNQRHLLRREFNDEALMGRHQRLDSEKEGHVTKWHNDVVIYADVSGSMPSSAVLKSFEFILELASQYGVSPITVHTYNVRIQQSFVITSNSDLKSLNIRTGGGTDIASAFKEKPPKNKLVFVLTDMEDSPVRKWDYEGELVWLIHQNSTTYFPDFVGKQICINDIIKKI